MRCSSHIQKETGSQSVNGSWFNVKLLLQHKHLRVFSHHTSLQSTLLHICTLQWQSSSLPWGPLNNLNIWNIPQVNQNLSAVQIWHTENEVQSLVWMGVYSEDLILLRSLQVLLNLMTRNTNLRQSFSTQEATFLMFLWKISMTSHDLTQFWKREVKYVKIQHFVLN